jgi:hypothetical protein
MDTLLPLPLRGKRVLDLSIEEKNKVDSGKKKKRVAREMEPQPLLQYMTDPNDLNLFHFWENVHLREPQLHYASLDDASKLTIRPFIFQDLPAELRLRVFDYLFVRPIAKGNPNSSSSTQPSVVAQSPIMACGRFHFLDWKPHLRIIETCRQLRDEGRQYFYTKNKLELQVALEYKHGRNALSVGDQMPLSSLHLPSLRHLRVEVFLRHGSGTRLDWGIISRMDNLEALQVTITCVLRLAQQRGSSLRSQSRRSRFAMLVIKLKLLVGMIKDVMEKVPPRINLRWGAWDLLIEDIAGGRVDGDGKKVDEYHFGGEIIEHMSRVVKHVRGRKSGKC